MSEEIFIRKSGCVGHITLNRPEVLNSLTYSMILSIEKALIEWETDVSIALVIIDAKGCLLYTSPSPRDNRVSRMPSSA